MTESAETTITYNDQNTGTLDDFRGKVVLVVNTASECGFTPQYQALQRLQEAYADRGFTVLAAPCNQFGEQEPGNDSEIAEFISEKFGGTLPVLAKADVNGPDAQPLFQALNQHADTQGEAGDIKWNFEKFLLAPDGEVLGRFRSATEPDAAEITEIIEANLPG